jgi:hypothetical protein
MRARGTAGGEMTASRLRSLTVPVLPPIAAGRRADRLAVDFEDRVREIDEAH